MSVVNLFQFEPDQEFFYILSPWGLGDTMVLCGFKGAIEKKLGGPVRFIVKPSHEIVMQLYGIRDYVPADIKLVYSQERHEVPEWPNIVETPRKGGIYIAHPEFHKDFSRLVFQMQTHEVAVDFLSWNLEFWGLPENTPFKLPAHYPTLSETVRAEFSQYYPGRKVREAVLLFPEAVTVMPLPRIFWDYLILKLRAEKIPVLTNIVNPETTPLFPGVPNLTSSLDQIIAFAMNCREVYALRSGVCDLLFRKQKKLHVFYPEERVKNIFSLRRLFASRADEQCFDDIRVRRIRGLRFEETTFSVCGSHLLLARRGAWLFCPADEEEFYEIVYAGDGVPAEKPLSRVTSFCFSDPPACVSLGRGFSGIESFGVWTEKTSAYFKWLIPEEFREKPLCLKLLMNAAFLGIDSLRLEIAVNGVSLIKTVLTKPDANLVELEIPGSLVVSAILDFRLRVPDAITSPHDIDVRNADIRRLGVGLRTAEITVGNDCKIPSGERVEHSETM